MQNQHYVELDSRLNPDGTRERRQQCLHCGHVGLLEHFNHKGIVDGFPITEHVIREHLR